MDRNQRRSRDNLDQPRESRRSFRNRRDADPERFGRFAETFARFMGTATFLAYMTVFILIWLLWNAPFGPDRPQWDEYPFIFLTLILLVQNRQEARDRVTQEQDRGANAQSHADMQFLAREVASLRLGLGEVATRDFLRSELRGFLSELEEKSACL